MKLNIEQLLSDIGVSIPADAVKALNEAINTKLNHIEKENSIKFESFVTGITKTIDNKIGNAITEGVKERVGDSVNKKLHGVVSKIASLLEDAGINFTEKTKELTQQLIQADEQLGLAFNQRQAIEKKLIDAEKNNLIFNRCKGMQPEVIDAALKYFEDKDIIDVQESLDSYLEGDFSSLIEDDSKYSEFTGNGDIEMDDIKGILDEFNSRKDKASQFGKSPSKQIKIMESKNVINNIGKGLKTQRALGGASRNPITGLETLMESGEDDGNDDVNRAMNSISNLQTSNYTFRRNTRFN